MKSLDLNNYQLEGELLHILTFPHPVLAKKAKEVTIFDEDLKTLCRHMLYTMYMAPGVGLAAPQIGTSLRIFCLDIEYERHTVLDHEGKETHTLSEFRPMIFINPIIVQKDGEQVYQEGCLSLPGIYENMKRSANIVVEFQNLQGEKQTLEASDLLAVCIQHEYDHLDGIVMLDHMQPMKKNLFKKKLIKQKKKSS